MPLNFSNEKCFRRTNSISFLFKVIIRSKLEYVSFVLQYILYHHRDNLKEIEHLTLVSSGFYPTRWFLYDTFPLLLEAAAYNQSVRLHNLMFTISRTLW